VQKHFKKFRNQCQHADKKAKTDTDKGQLIKTPRFGGGCLSLFSFKFWVSFVDNEDAAFSADEFGVLVAIFERF
jgi:hypothetical protein